MAILAQAGLLSDKHFHEGFAVLVLLELFEQRLLRFRHRTADAMPFAFEFADIDTRAWGFRRFIFSHLNYLANKPGTNVPGQSWVTLIY